MDNTKTLDTLVEDIYRLFEEGADVSDEVASQLGNAIATTLTRRLDEPRNPRTPSLSMSRLGTHPLELWYDLHGYEPEAFRPEVYLKFLLGDIIEEVVLALAEIAGHKVEGRQDVITLEGIKGHRDAIIDGVTVDVKSASPYSFKKFKYGELTHENDGFGYLYQLPAYVEGESEEGAPKPTTKDAAFVAMDKVSGELCVMHIPEFMQSDVRQRAIDMKEMMARETPPTPEEAPLSIKPDGKSGNMILDVPCSYHRHKFNYLPNLRMFIYSTGPRYFTHVEREPSVPEIDIKTGEYIEKEANAF